MKEAHADLFKAAQALRPWLGLLAGACLATVAAGAAGAGPAHLAALGNGAAPVLAHATDLGPVSASTPLSLTVWLKLRDTAGLDSTLSAQHSGGAAWLSQAEIDALHAPAAADAAAVSAYLKSQGLTVTAIGQDNLFVKATGDAATVESAFGVQLHQYTYRGTTFRASPSRPKLPAAIAARVTHIGGLSDIRPRPMLATAHLSAGAHTNIVTTNGAEGLPPTLYPLATTSPSGLFFSAQCFYPPTTESFSGGGATASYSGQVYGAPITNTVPDLSPCGYQPSDLQTAYNLQTLYQAGLNGTGETIAIVDAYGSITIAADVATFSQLYGLPPLSLKVIGTPTGLTYSSNQELSLWAQETSLDVEWVHSIAPGAKIVLVVAPSSSYDDLFAAEAKAAAQPGVAAISNSWAGDESLTDGSQRTAADAVLKLAGARGISADFAAGDEGNEAFDLGYIDVNYPGSSPYATAVGGVSVALNPSKHIQFQTAWGNNVTEIADTEALGSPPLDPPVSEGFVYGGGGGESNVYPLPAFQASLAALGQRRLVPDISWVADPFTGVEFIITADSQGDQEVGVVGGTSVSTPLFTALWGIAVQKAGHLLGQAAPVLYSLPPGAITDVVAPGSSFVNVTGTLSDDTGTQKLTGPELALPLQGLPTYVSALYQGPTSTRWYVLTFGTDSSLAATPGWDPATGLGTPNGPAFVDAVSSVR